MKKKVAIVINETPKKYLEVLSKTNCKPLNLVDEELRQILEISWDFEDDPSNRKEWRAVILSVPDKSKHEHEHFVLTNKKARELRDWLDNYLQEVEGSGRSSPPPKKSSVKRRKAKN